MMRSIGGSSTAASAGAVRRFGPMVRNGSRTPIRGSRTGSVMIQTPKKFMSTVEWPSHDAVRLLSLHVCGSGLVNGGAMDRRRSTVHWRQR